MSRAITTMPGSAASSLPRPLAAIVNFFAAFWRASTRDAVRPYRPELHYMRGPGPAWRAKYGQDKANSGRGSGHAATHFV